MSRLMQFLIHAYLPLVARQTLIDGPAHAGIKPSVPVPAGGEAKLAHFATGPRRPARRDDDRQVTTLAA